MSNSEQLKAKTKKGKDRLEFKNVVEELKKAKFGFSMPLFWFVFLTMLSLILAYVFPFSLIVTIPFVIVPAYFAFTSMNAVKGVKHGEQATFWKMYRIYFSPIFFGGYRLFFGLLKAFIAYFAVSTIGLSIVLYTNPSYQGLVSNVANISNINEIYEEMENILLQPKIEKAFYLITTIALVFGAVLFIQHIMKHSPKMRRNLYTRQVIPMKQFNIVEKTLRKQKRKFILTSYLGTSWFIQFLIVLTLSGGIVLSYFLLKNFDIGQAFVISLFLMFVCITPLLNYISVTQDLMYVALMKDYEQTFVNLTLEFLTKYKDKIGLEEEDANKIKDFLEQAKKESEKPIEKEKEKNDTEDK